MKSFGREIESINALLDIAKMQKRLFFRETSETVAMMEALERKLKYGQISEEQYHGFMIAMHSDSVAWAIYLDDLQSERTCIAEAWEYASAIQ